MQTLAWGDFFLVILGFILFFVGVFLGILIFDGRWVRCAHCNTPLPRKRFRWHLNVNGERHIVCRRCWQKSIFENTTTFKESDHS